MGVHFGPLMLGIIGENQRMSCDVISAAVNLSSRIENLTKHYGTPLLISEAVHSQTPEFLARAIDNVRVAGTATSLWLYEVLGFEGSAPKESRQLVESFAAARTLYSQGDFMEALDAFRESPLDKDPPSIVFKDRCVQLLREEPSKWKDLWIFKHK